jgi:hypothetical protein
MPQNRQSGSNVLTRGFSAIAVFAVCSFGVAGASAVLLGASSTAALAHGGGGHGGGGGGGHGGGGFRGGGFRGGGFGFGYWGLDMTILTAMAVTTISTRRLVMWPGVAS